MADSAPPLTAAHLGKVTNGVFDVVFALALALEAKGLLPRSEIADLLAGVIRGATVQEGGHTVRVEIAELMLQALSTPIAGADARSRLKVIDGGVE